MYDFIDRPVTSLDAGGRFLIWSLRSWVVASNGKACPHRTLAPAFARWKMIGALQPFHRMMLILNRDALDRLRFCSLRCNHISEHEAVMLSLVVTLRERGPVPVRDTLALIVEEDAVGDLLGAIVDLAAKMMEAGIPFERSCGGTAHPAGRGSES